MPPVVADATEWSLDQIGRIRRGVSANRAKPHKLVMLLAVLDLAQDGLLNRNKIYYAEPLLIRFKKYYSLVERKDDWYQPAPPFFHLRSSDLWNHKIKLGQERVYSRLTTSGGGSKRITDNIEYAYLDDRAFMAFNHPIARKKLYGFIFSQLDIPFDPETLKMAK